MLSQAEKPKRKLPMPDTGENARFFLDYDNDEDLRLVVEWSDAEEDAGEATYRLKYGTEDELEVLHEWLRELDSVTVVELEARGFQTASY